HITWTIDPAQDNVFANNKLSFEIADGTNPNLVTSIQHGGLDCDTKVQDLKVTTKVPNIRSGKAYTIKAAYKDATEFIYWYSPSFSVDCDAVTSSAAVKTTSLPSASSVATYSPTNQGTTQGNIKTGVSPNLDHSSLLINAQRTQITLESRMQTVAVLAVAAVGAFAQSAATSAAVSATSAAAAPTSAAAPAAGASGQDTCTTTKGGRLSIITPLTGASIAAGSAFTITWNLENSGDTDFNDKAAAFDLLDASNPNNAATIASLVISPSNATFKSAQASATIPVNTKQVSKYALRSAYLDADSKWRYCFSPQFTVTGLGVAVTTAPASNATSASASAPAPTSKSSASGLVAGVAALFAALAF
ncbi:hypothetical protein BC830DRAFT_1175907, partial [Chytriomyces sp. MP71]